MIFSPLSRLYTHTSPSVVERMFPGLPYRAVICRAVSPRSGFTGAEDEESVAHPTARSATDKTNRPERRFTARRIYFSLPRTSLMALKLGKSFGVGVCSLYCTTPFLSMTKAARAEVSPTPASIGNTTSYDLVTLLFKSL